MKKTFRMLACLAFLSISLDGCMTLEHTVGNGGSGSQVTANRQWYILWGLVPLNQVDGEKMALEKGLTNNYTVKSQMSFIDVLLNIITGTVSVYGQTVSVSK
ncbi:MAG TPA: hypothetical protein VHE12_12285 [bacterium]|nr:hypothetical protein [bacterium]